MQAVNKAKFWEENDVLGVDFVITTQREEGENLNSFFFCLGGKDLTKF